MELLGEAEKKITQGEKEKRKKNEEEDITREETTRAIGSIKNEKAAGIDDVPNEVWEYGGKGIKEVGVDNEQQSVERGGLAFNLI